MAEKTDSVPLSDVALTDASGPAENAFPGRGPPTVSK